MEADEGAILLRLYSSAVKANKKLPSRLDKPAEGLQHPDPEDPLGDLYGYLPLIQSASRTDRQWTEIKDLDLGALQNEVWVRARVHNTRLKGNGGFVVLRESYYTAQCAVFKSPTISKSMVKFAGSIPNESIVDVLGLVKVPTVEIQGCTQKAVELEIKKIFVVSKAVNQLPLQIEDCSRPVTLAEEEQVQDEDAADTKKIGVKQKTRLDNRVIDLRTPSSLAIMRINSHVCRLFREFLSDRGFTEIHTPKLIAGTSEGGSEVFRLDYFGRKACLAQSPQLYKQMAIMADLGRVFEIGPVFRAENSNTHRHMCEFTGLDFEMTIKEHYFEVMELIHDLFIFMFKGLAAACQEELAAIYKQFPFIDPLVYTDEPLFLTFAEASALLTESGHPHDPSKDLTTEEEKVLGGIVKEKYRTEFYIVHRYPATVRPFYTMPAPDDASLTNSYDVFIRGEEIISGAQRVHDPELLTAQAVAKGIDIATVKDYIDSFRYGATPHGGCGIGLERVVMLFTGLKNIRRISMFPRDPKRLTP
jgi:aspartyl-tRNA synthetase